MRTVNTHPSGMTYHTLSGANMEELAAAVRKRASPTAGEMYIRKLREDPATDRNKWICSREPVRRLWSEIPGELRVLTLPGLHWKLEKSLLKTRRNLGLKTQFTAAERDQSIFRVSINGMPRYKELSLVDTKTVRSEVAWYECCEVEDLIARTNWKWTAAWLDWNGPLSLKGVEAIKQLWPRLSHSLVLTFMVARYSGEVKSLRDKAGGWGPAVANLIGLPRERVHETRYQSGAGSMTFAQVTAIKPNVKTEIVRVCRYVNGIKLEELYGKNSQTEGDQR